ncbi:MAG: PEP-utilizing enzyme, partial [Chloroflexota bacterium]|nr:PEP-utilizing enzyme [Chloroflexota bacterium]
RDLGGAVAAAAGVTPDELLGRLDLGDPVLAERLADLTIDRERAAFLLGALDAVGESLAARGMLRTPGELWWQTVDWVDSALASDSPPPSTGWVADRWGHLIFGATVRHGRRSAGISAGHGWAVGPATFIAEPDEGGSFPNRDVLVVAQPLPSFAPLLWRAAALVSLTGSPAAHLCEVARSLRLPTVVSVDLDRFAPGGALAVDGSSGDVWLWAADGPAPTAGSVRPTSAEPAILAIEPIGAAGSAGRNR